MKRTLHLSSPFMHGADVLYAQRLMLGNAYGIQVDMGARGVFDDKTGHAAVRVKYLLGYPQSEVVPTFGTKLEKFLRKTDPKEALPLTYRIRRKRRLAAEQKTIGQKALDVAITYLGVKENPPNSNVCPPFTPWYHNYVGPWCAVFWSFCASKAGSKYPVPGSRWAYCPYMVADARAHRNGLVAITAAEARPGDIVLYDWPGESPGVADHVGYFEKWTNKAAGAFDAIEGNTAVGNDSNGGEVMRRERSVSNVLQFARLTG